MKLHSTPRDLILATLHRGEFATVEPFVRSLKRTGYAGQTVFFTSQVGSTTEAELRLNGADVVPFHFLGKRDRQPLARLWPLWRRYFASGASASAKTWLAHRVLHLRYRRYWLYAEFLRQHAADFDRVMLTDSRDVFFQADPFSWEMSPGVHCVLEEPQVRLGHCPLHRRWLGFQFGREFVKQHAERTASCSGTTFGDTASILEYLAQMKTVIMQARSLAKISGGDQGIHNFLLIEKKLKHVTIHANRRGPVLTMGVMQAGDYRLNSAGRALNDDGGVPPVLHQYDRLPELKKHLLANAGGAA